MASEKGDGDLSGRVSTKRRRISMDDALKHKVAEPKKDDENCEELNKVFVEAKERLQKKEEKLRKLKLVSHYQAENDLTRMDNLIKKWTQVTQEAVVELHATMAAEPKPTLTSLIDHLKIDHKLIHFDAEEEDFVN